MAMRKNYYIYIDFRSGKRPLKYVNLNDAKSIIEAGRKAEEYIDTLSQAERREIYCIGLQENEDIIGRFRPYEWYGNITFGFHFEN